MDIREALKHNILLMDGAMGTYYETLHRTEKAQGTPEQAVLVHPEWIKEIHKEYIRAGADIIRTDTFALGQRKADTKETEQYVRAAAALAKEAAEEVREETKNRTIYIAASIGPAAYTEEQEEAEVYASYQNIIKTFWDCGIRIFCFETFSDTAMVKRLAAFAKQCSGDSFVMAQFVFNRMGYTRYGFSMQRLIQELSEIKEIDVFGFNCGIGAAHMSELFEKVTFPKDCLISVLPNAGYQQELTGRDLYFNNPGYFARHMQNILKKGVNVIGCCCGTTPEYTKELKKLLKQDNTPKAKRMEQTAQPEDTVKEKNTFMEKLEKGEKVIAVELDSPFGSSADKFLEGAFRLKENGVDLVTIADSPMAKARADAFTMAIYAQNKTGLSVMPHISCRDRNLIGMHAAFLGAHINDIRNLLIITGDPVAREDQGAVTPVFDFSSIKLMEYVKNMNKEVFAKDPFYYGGALNYATGRLETIAERMKKKMAAGCSYFLTQPIYSEEDMSRVHELKKMTNAKILCGIMPLVSLKNARFMQNEMPGIHVPEEIVARYTADMSREEAEQTAVSVSVEIGGKMKDFADGYYIMTPFYRVAMVNKIIAGLRKNK
jgi:homocysteine S-methyltransferase